MNVCKEFLFYTIHTSYRSELVTYRSGRPTQLTIQSIQPYACPIIASLANRFHYRAKFLRDFFERTDLK